MSIEVRWVRAAAQVCLAALGFSLGAKAQGDPLYWAVGRSLEAAPMSVAPDKAGTLAPEDLLLWKEGRGFAELPKGRPFPKDLPPGVLVEVATASREGEVAAGLGLEYRPADWPNLPAPLGRVQTDGRGKARLFFPRGGRSWCGLPIRPIFPSPFWWTDSRPALNSGPNLRLPQASVWRGPTSGRWGAPRFFSCPLRLPAIPYGSPGKGPAPRAVRRRTPKAL